MAVLFSNIPFDMLVKSAYQLSPKGFIRLAEGFNPVRLYSLCTHLFSNIPFGMLVKSAYQLSPKGAIL